MSTTITAIFDGEVLRPDGPVELTPNARYIVTVDEAPAKPAPAQDAWTVLDGLTGTVEASPDWAEEHDHYLYGTPKLRGGGTG